MAKHIITISLLVFMLFGILAPSAHAQENEATVEPAGKTPIAFMITERTLKELRKQEVDEDVLSKLEALQDQLVETEERFVAQLQENLGEDVFEHHRDAILNLAYVYDATGRREPFKSPLKLPEGDATPGPPVGDKCPPPFGDYEGGQFQVIGIVLGEPGDRARIKAPDGKAYTVTPGTCIGKFSGIVTTISETCVTIKETRRYTKGEETIVEEPETRLCLQEADE